MEESEGGMGERGEKSKMRRRGGRNKMKIKRCWIEKNWFLRAELQQFWRMNRWVESTLEMEEQKMGKKENEGREI